MKNTVRSTIIVLLAAILALSFASCGEKGYRDDVSVASVADEINKSLSNIENLDKADENYISIQQKFPLDKCAEYVEMFQTSGIGIDEYGIFKMNDAESAEAMKTAIESYLTTARATFNENYAPNERPKIEASEVRVFGNYVMYAVLSDSEKEAAFGTLESALKK